MINSHFILSRIDRKDGRMTEEVLKQTQVLFTQIEKLTTDEEKLPLRTQVYKLNHGIVTNELNKLKMRYNDMFGSMRDDLYSAITEALWKTICLYDSSKGANLYTIATYHIKEAVTGVIRSEVTKNTLTAHDFKTYLKMRERVNQGATKEELINSGEFGTSGRTVNSIYQLAVGGAFVSDSDAIVTSLTDHENGYKALESTEWIDYIRGNVCKNDDDNWMFDQILESGTVDINATIKTFHLKRPQAARQICSFMRRLKVAVKKDLSGKDLSDLQISPEFGNLLSNDLTIVLDDTTPKFEADNNVIVLDDVRKGGEKVESSVPKEVRKAAAEEKLDTGIDLGIKQFIDDRVREKIDTMSIDEIANYVKETLNAQ